MQPQRAAVAQTPAIDARSVLASLTPAERVGQLFVVPFDGADVADGSPVARLVDAHHVGGVVLDPRRGNFTNAADAPAQVARLANQLQSRAAEAGGTFVPMVVALSQLGDEFPDNELWGGMTVPPSEMALGATWKPEEAERVGEVVGRELAAAGVNLTLGPNLDVVTQPRPASSGDLGTRVFGGSPSWVARFGAAYVQGVEQGGAGRVATACASFPGLGAADRNPAEEAAVVESGLQQLLETDLEPFLAVAGGGAQPATAAVVSSHVRYRALQQQTDRPFSLDSGGMRYLWSQVPALGRWRDAGGVVISAGLGAPTVRRYADPYLAEFNVRRVIGEAVAAGNDLLLVTDFGTPGDPTNGQANIEAAMDWLVDRYGQDESVREAVDAAALRVLEMKARMYGRFSVEHALVDADAAPAATGLGEDVAAEVAGAALTAVAPSGASPSAASIAAPQPGDAVLFVVDERPVLECPGCQPRASISVADLVDRVRQRYGPGGSGRLLADEDASGITFGELKAWLQDRGALSGEETSAPAPPLAPERRQEVDGLIRDADWMVFAMRDVRAADSPAWDAMKLFLESSASDQPNRRLVALAFGAPYYLDTSEIAKLHAYYALYSRGAAFADVAVRALFRDAPATGASPVSVPGAAYDLATRLQPAFEQKVDLELVGHDPSRPLAVGDELTIRSTVILDGNGHPAPDGTKVTFRRYDGDEGVFLADVPATTRSGRVTQVMRAERAGEVTVNAYFDNGLRSEPLVLRIADLPAAAAILQDVALPQEWMAVRVPVAWSVLLLSLTLILLAGVMGYGVGAEDRPPGAAERTVLLCLAWGLAGYLLVSTGGLPLGRGHGGLPFWPASWPDAYLAPVLSFALALVPVVPGALRDFRARWRRPPG
jgi:beta-N-acetylhexosaminidase